jgi:imidazolonepropionase-like amidohydrolase
MSTRRDGESARPPFGRRVWTLLLTVVGVSLAVAACGPDGGAGDADARSGEVLVVRGGGLFDGTGDELRTNPGIVIRDGRFAAIDRERADAAVDAGAAVIQLSEGEVVIPGLFDLHAHYAIDLRGEGRIDETEVYPGLFVANGVTSTFPAGEVQPYRMRDLRIRIESGEQIGPRLFNSGPYFGADRQGWDPEITTQGIYEEVDYWVAQGARGFKAKGITAPHLQALIERAHEHGVTVTGHLGSGYRESVNPRDAIEMGIDRVEHFMGGDAMTPDRSAYGSLVEMTPEMPEFERIARHYIDSGTYFNATIATYGYWAERQPAELYEYFEDEMGYLTPYARELVESRLPRPLNETFEQILRVKVQLIKRFYDLGGGDWITLGTDHPSWGEYFTPFGVHRELHVFVLAGIPEASALRFGTINAARALRVDHELGTIEEGKLADLVILRGNPLEDIRNTRHPRQVIKGGQIYDPQALLDAARGQLGPAGPEELEEW